MIIGMLKETRPEEFRTPLTPEGVGFITDKGHTVIIEESSGFQAGFTDSEYKKAGGAVLSDPGEITDKADLIVKVKEPLPREYDLFQKNQALFCYIHVYNEAGLIKMLMEKKMTGISFQRVKLEDGFAPLLSPMSIIAGQQAVLQGMQFMWSHKNGPGKSIIPYPGLDRFRVVILGGGVAGENAARTAAALGATVHLFEVDLKRLDELFLSLPKDVRLMHPDQVSPGPYARAADMIINTATTPPESKKHLITAEMVSKMRNGSIIVDVTSHIRGAVETVDRSTTHNDPVWEVDGVLHYAVRNIPGVVANTASQALSMALSPYLSEIAELGVAGALEKNGALARGGVVVEGEPDSSLGLGS